MAVKKGIKPVAQNRRARHDFFILETHEAGIALKGTEVKSIRQGRVNLKESFAQARQGEIFVEGMHISPYEQGNRFNCDPLRAKRLLLHKAEIRKLAASVQKKGYTLIPLQLYLKNGRVKLELGLCVGKHLHDKRETIAKKEAEREMERAFSQKNFRL